MVSFNCSGCGDVITKGKIKAHAQRCHIGSLDCLDCRAQKVQGKLFKAAKKPGAPRKQPAATPAAEDEGASPSKRAKPASPTPEAPLVVAEPLIAPQPIAVSLDQLKALGVGDTRVKLAALVDGVLGSAAHRADVETAIKRVLESAAQSGLVRFDGKKVKPCKKHAALSSDACFSASALHEGYRSGRYTVAAVVEECVKRLEWTNNAFIFKTPREHLVAAARTQDAQLERARTTGPEAVTELLRSQPLFGLPFAVKDNIDVAGFPTTAGCPSFAYTPWKSATVVDMVTRGGAILVGKHNMDQFAAGLVGVRTPYGIPVNPFNAAYVPGGSSSGAGVSVASGQVSFALGTDTAGSGRIPASFTNVVGLKPTRGLLSTSGVFPACRSLDCVSVFALTVDDAWRVFSVARESHDEEFCRPLEDQTAPYRSSSRALRFGVPRELAFFGDTTGARELYADAQRTLAANHPTAEFVPIDFEPFTEAARSLYEGPWISERLAAVSTFMENSARDVHPVTRSILERGRTYSAVEAWRAFHKLEHLRYRVRNLWRQHSLDALLVPTASITPTIDEVQQVPIGINTVLGYYTNFTNLLDLAAIATPNGFLPSGLPSGVTFIGRANDDAFLCRVARDFQRARNLPLGATQHRLPPRAPTLLDVNAAGNDAVRVAVCGAHMSGMPLNKQLQDLDATLVSATRTSPQYRMYDISRPNDTLPPRPGLVRVGEGEKGASIALEVWEMSTRSYGVFVSRSVKPPLAIGHVALEDGSVVQGFVCEPHALAHAVDVTHHGGWRAYRAKQ